MTQMGHSLMGIAFGAACLPRQASWRRKAIHLAGFVFLANIPDVPLPGWSHEQYHISHSLWVNLALIAILSIIALLFAPGRPRKQNVVLFVMGSLAWLSHLLLDSFYNHGGGIAIFWPFSPAHLILTMPWFSIVPNTPPPLTWAHIRIFAIEFAFYAPIAALGFAVGRVKNVKITGKYGKF